MTGRECLINFFLVFKQRIDNSRLCVHRTLEFLDMHGLLLLNLSNRLRVFNHDLRLGFLLVDDCFGHDLGHAVFDPCGGVFHEPLHIVEHVRRVVVLDFAVEGA